MAGTGNTPTRSRSSTMPTRALAPSATARRSPRPARESWAVVPAVCSGLASCTRFSSGPLMCGEVWHRRVTATTTRKYLSRSVATSNGDERPGVGDRLAWTEQMPERSRMIDLTEPVERAFLIGLVNPMDGQWPVGRSLAESGALAETAGATVVGSAFQSRGQPDPVWYLGKGRAAELVDEKAASNLNLLVVDD